MLVTEHAKSFRVKKAIFPEGTEKLETHEECNHCAKPLFLAFRDSDLHPVLACAMCGRLYLSKGTAKILAQAGKELRKTGGESFYSFGSHGRQRAFLQAIKPKETSSWPGSSHLSGLQSKFETQNLAGGENEMRSTERKSEWRSGSEILSLQLGLMGSNIQGDGIMPKKSEREHSKLYELSFNIDTPETRARVLEALLTVNEVFPNKCWISQQNHTITFRAIPSSVNKEFVKILLQILGQLCGFKLTFAQVPNYETLRASLGGVKPLLTVLTCLGQKWEPK